MSAATSSRDRSTRIAASACLARLEEQGLIRRDDAAHDRRVKTASVTPEGHRIVEAIDQGRRRLLDETFADWSERDRAAFARLSRRFADSMFALVDTGDEEARPSPG